MNKNAFFKYVESRGQNAYGSAILVKTQADTDGKYSLLIASETVPAIFGTQGSFEFNLVNAPTIGKIADKMTLDDKEVEFLLHRDNIYRLESLKDQILDFLYLTPDLMAWKFTGTISARPNDATAEILRGTYTITPMSADPTPIMDARPLIKETIAITNSVPDSIQISNSTTGTSIDIECDVVGFTASVVIKNSEGVGANFSSEGITTATSGKTGSISIIAPNATDEDYAIAYITVSKTGYASWTTTVALQGGGSAT